MECRQRHGGGRGGRSSLARVPESGESYAPGYTSDALKMLASRTVADRVLTDVDGFFEQRRVRVIGVRAARPAGMR